MPAYNFKNPFADLVEQGMKNQTIRPRRLSRPTVPGDVLYLYTGMRTRRCRLLRPDLPICRSVVPITISGACINLGGRTLDPIEEELLAIDDGFLAQGGESGPMRMRFFFDSVYGLPTCDLELVTWP